MSVGLVLVSHSATLAAGLQELAAQMAADVPIRAAGGTDDDGLGTSYERIDAAVTELLEQGHEVVLLTDLGSATMTVEMLLEMHDDEPVHFADAPFVEGAVAAAVAAQQGEPLERVAQAAIKAADTFRRQGSGDDAAGTQLNGSDAEASGAGEQETPSAGGDSVYRCTATVADASGLHARPAAKLAELVGDADVLLNDVEADSALMVMGLGLRQGDTVTVSGTQRDVVDAVADAIEAGLDA